jgi:hypothetical protein
MKAKTLLIILIFILMLPINALVRGHPITWDIKKIEQTLTVGGTQTLTVTFTSNKDIQNVKLWVVPALKPYITVVDPANSFSIVANTAYTVDLNISIPPGAQSGLYDGTIHIKHAEGSKTYTRPLPVELNIEEGSYMENEDSPGHVGIGGVSETSFNPQLGTIYFEAIGVTFYTDPADVLILVNDQPVPEDSITITPEVIIFDYAFVDDRNELLLLALDNQELSLSAEAVLWAGSNELLVNVSDEGGQPVSGAVVTAKLGDDQDVQVQSTTVNGQVSFQNLPSRTLLLTAEDSEGRFGALTATGIETTVDIVITGFGPPSPIDNNDFSLGTEGWDIGDAPVVLIPHVENSTNTNTLAAVSTAASEDWDLMVMTLGEGGHSITRTFPSKPGTRTVAVRYKFVTSEVPGGYCGSEFNDSFRVVIRYNDPIAFLIAKEQNTMNGLGCGAFDASGATEWREVSLPVMGDPGTVKIEVGVANVGDGLYDSSVVIDLVEEKALAITNLDLRDLDNTGLRRLSAAAHPWFSGNTLINGTITVEGDSESELDSLVLEILQGGSVVATANLSSGAASTLLQSFGSDEKVEITTSQRLFQLSSGQAAQINSSQNGTLGLRVRAISGDQNITEDFRRSVQILARFGGVLRYGVRNVLMGGDDWVKPEVRPVIEHFNQFRYDSASNMNGGPFQPHNGHRNGNEVDAAFYGYNPLNDPTRQGTAQGTAQRLIDMFNDPTYGSRIRYVTVTFNRVNSDPFWQAIMNVTLNDGRPVTRVFRRAINHDTHFHMAITNQ